MASSSTQPPALPPDEWVYDIPTPNAPPMTDATLVPKESLGDIDMVPSYSILNGRPEDMQPYLLRGTIPAATHWVPLNGIAPKDAIKCVDGFIKSTLYQLTTNGGYNRDAGFNRTAAIILGTARAVMTTNYEIRTSDLIPAETAGPVLHARVLPNGTAVYHSILAPNDNNGAIATAPLHLTPAENTLVRVVMRSAQAVVPLQGLNLITEGHHYLSDRSKSSFKAFQAVERQVWMPQEFKDMLATNEEGFRDLMWHKSGHPIVVQLKELAATSPKVKENLEGVKLGSAVARLPALEADVRAAQTYQKVAEAVGPIWEMMDGSIDPSLIRSCLIVLEKLPRGGAGFEKPFPLTPDLSIRTRPEVLDVLRKIVKANADKVAYAFGFYSLMVDRGAAEGAVGGGDTLRKAFSLKKLMSECAASYSMGQELFKDYQAVKLKQRNKGEIGVPRYVLNL